jgi:energy-coupling factor transporter ATP-binding protein EcfA2
MIKIENLGFTFGTHLDPVFRAVNLEIEPGELVLVCGPTGSGKSTFLKTINGLAPHFSGGTLTGKIFINGAESTRKRPHELADLVAYVNQKPEGAFATDTVEEELAFGLEQLGWSQSAMLQRVEELAAQFELSDLLNRHLADLSGGQQQRVAIAAALAPRQRVLILDEPTSALDSQSSGALLTLLSDLAHNHGLTVIVAEHRTKAVLPFADSLLMVSGDSSVHKLAQLEPASCTQAEQKTESILRDQPISRSQPLFRGKALTAKYGNLEALAPIDLELRAGSVTSVVGPNGSGKTSLLWSVVREAWRQKLEVAMVPQNAADLLFLNTLAEELAEADSLNALPALTTANLFESLVGRVDPSTHPRDLSSGQQLALVLAIQLSKKSQLIILDEPTRGLSSKAIKSLEAMLGNLRGSGHAILLATHDHDLVVSVSDEVLTLERGVLQNRGDGHDQ